MASVAAETPAGHGHSFSKKTFHKPTYCHHCSDMLWGLIQQGYICEGKCIFYLTCTKMACVCVVLHAGRWGVKYWGSPLQPRPGLFCSPTASSWPPTPPFSYRMDRTVLSDYHFIKKEISLLNQSYVPVCSSKQCCGTSTFVNGTGGRGLSLGPFRHRQLRIRCILCTENCCHVYFATQYSSELVLRSDSWLMTCTDVPTSTTFSKCARDSNIPSEVL